MALPKPPPNIRQIIADDRSGFWELFNKPDTQAIISRANKKYAYWIPFKYWKFPPGYSPALAWALTKIVGRGNRVFFPLKDKKGEPFSYALVDSVNQLLHEIDRASGGQTLFKDEDLDPSIRKGLLIDALTEEAIASSQIEGASTTREVARAMLRSGRKPANKSELMIFNNFQAMERIKLLTDAPLSIELLHELHEILTRGTLKDPGAAGRFRLAEENIVVEDPRDNTLLHEPPAAGELPQRAQALCDFANSRDPGNFVHPILKAILLHFWIGYDHPFVDGNGRAARAVFYWYALRHNYALLEFLPISTIIIRAPWQYARSYLYSEIDDNDVTYFLHYNLRAIHSAIREAQLLIQAKKRAYFASASLLRQVRGVNHRQVFLLGHALKHPSATYTIHRHKELHDIVYQTARNDLLDLAEKGFLDRIKRGKTYEFYPGRNLKEKIEVLAKGAASP